MTVIDEAIARGDTDAVRAEVDRLLREPAEDQIQRRPEDMETDMWITHLGDTNPAAIDRMLASQS